HKRFSKECATFLHAVLEELLKVVVQAEMVTPPRVLRRFTAVVVEDSSTISLPEELAQLWRGCGGNQRHTAAALKLHVRWELLRGRLWGPALTEGRCSDHRSPLALEELPEGSLYVTDLGYFCLREIAQRHRQHRYTLTRLRVGTKLFDQQRKPMALERGVLPPRVGQMKELRVRVGAQEQVPRRLLMLRVPKAIADKRREDLKADAQRRQQSVSEEALREASWTILITDAPAKRLPFQAALVRLARTLADGTAFQIMETAGASRMALKLVPIGDPLRSPWAGCIPQHLSRKRAKRNGRIKSIQCRRLPGSIDCINRPGPFQPELILAIAIACPDRISVSNNKLLVPLVKR